MTVSPPGRGFYTLLQNKDHSFCKILITNMNLKIEAHDMSRVKVRK